MDFSERNKKVALARWKRAHSKEREKIVRTNEAIRYKAAICGFLAGDGSVQIRKEKESIHYQIDFFPDDPLMLETYRDAIKHVYGKTPSVRRRDNVYAVRLTSRVVLEDISQQAKFGVQLWDMPQTLFTTSGAKEAWLRAFFSAEAYVSPKSIRIQTVNRAGMKAVSHLLTSMGIANKYYEYTPKKKNHSTVGIVIIAKREARKIYYEKIGFWHSRKTNALKKALNL